MKEVTLSIDQIKELENNFSQAALVSRADNEDVETYKRFKYAAGKNYETCRAVLKRTAKRLKSILDKPPAYIDYENKSNVILCAHAKRKPNGDIDYLEKDEQLIYQFTADGEKAVYEEMNALDAEYEVVRSAYAKQQAAAEAVMAELVTITLHTFPWCDLPERMSGGYMAAITPMLIGIPNEFAD